MEKNWMELLEQSGQVSIIMQTNEYSEKFGLTLTEEESKALVTERKNSLKEQRRVEFGQGILPKLIYAFCDSQYISQKNYEDTLAQLQDIFYLYKNEIMDEITDDELLHFMREQFDTVCFGDIDYLAGTCLDNFAQTIRAGYADYKRTEGYGVYGTIDAVPRWDYDLYLQTLQDLCWK